MKITDILISRFGVWEDLTLPLSETGLSLFYGPNEAGKSTLMRFVRGVLYGYRDSDEQTAGPNPRRIECDGSLRVEYDGREYELRRTSHVGTRGRLTIDGIDRGRDADKLLESMLAGVNESVYENIFAIGLHELQQLATLDAEEVAEHIYGLSLGNDGERLMDAQQAAFDQRSKLYNPGGTNGRLRDLRSRYASLTREIESAGGDSRQYADLRRERERIALGIDDRKRRQELLQQELRGHRLLDRVHGPSSRTRELQAELDRLPSLGSFGLDGLTRLDDLELQIGDQDHRRSQLLSEAKRIRKAAEQQGAKVWEENQCVIQHLHDTLEVTRTLDDATSRHEEEAERTRNEYRDTLHAAGTGWNTERLDRVDTSPTAAVDLLNAARSYQKATSKRSRAVRKYQRMSSDTPRPETKSEYDHLSGASLTEAIDQTRTRISDLETYARLSQQEGFLSERLAGVRELLKNNADAPTDINLDVEDSDLPPYFYWVLRFLTVAGIVLFALGLILFANGTFRTTDMGHSILIGAIYTLAGFFCLGIPRAIREHYQSIGILHSSIDLGSLRDRERSTDGSLKEVRREIDRLIGTNGSLAGTPLKQVAQRQGKPLNEALSSMSQNVTGVYRPVTPEPAVLGGDGLAVADVISQEARRLAELESIAGRRNPGTGDRQQMTDYRGRLKEIQREHADARREWCNVLRQVGLDETLKVDDAFSTWQQLVSAEHLRKNWQLLKQDIDRDREIVNEYHRQVEDLAKKLDDRDWNRPDVYRTVVRWADKLADLTSAREERKRLVRQYKGKKKEADRIVTRLTDLKSQRSSLLMQAGVSSRDELDVRLKAYERQREVTRLLEQAQQEVQSISSSEPDLAIVEDQLLQFDAALNKASMERLQQDIDDLERQLQSDHERLGSINGELQGLRNDRRLATLRFDREQVAAELKEAAEGWVAAELSVAALDTMRDRMEKERQPGTLRHASDYLKRLTVGRYERIWSPIGERHLVVDDDQGESLRIEHLSTGTREQVFLSIRLAMIRALADDGVHLPMVLDDVFVNFDQTRTEAATETMLDFADDVQQVLLFTCHLHLAHMFESRNVDPIWLPGHQSTIDS